jgi:hypothetical protein
MIDQLPNIDNANSTSVLDDFTIRPRGDLDVV